MTSPPDVISCEATYQYGHSPHDSSGVISFESIRLARKRAKTAFPGGGSKRSTAELIAREEVSSSVLRTISSFPAAYLRRLREPPKDVPLCVRTPLAPLRAAVTESSLKMAE